MGRTVVDGRCFALGAALSLARLSPWGLRRAATAARAERPNLSPVASVRNEVPPELPGAGIGVCYRPAERGHDVGGDWYDVFELPGGRIGFAVGDVVGHDLDAAVAMGRPQQMLRYVAASGARPGAPGTP